MYVPDRDYRDFLALCAQCVDDGESLYVVERPSAQFRAYADFDVHLPASQTDVDAYVDALTRTFATAAAHHLEVESPTVVLVAEPKPIAAGLKVGVHLVMPRTCVDVEGAERMRTAVMAQLVAAEALQTPLNGWDDAFDASVYRQGGLRLVGCRKMTPCTCPAGPCPHPMRKVDAGRPYLLRHVLNAEGAVDDKWTRTLRLNAAMRTIMSSIRLPCDAPPPERKKKAAAQHKKQRTGSVRLVDVVDAAALDVRHRGLNVVIDGRLLRAVGDGDRYCPRVQREHSQSSVYFVVGTDGVALRCHCKKGDCPAFRGRPMPLSRRGAELLGMRVSDRGLPPGFV